MEAELVAGVRGKEDRNDLCQGEEGALKPQYYLFRTAPSKAKLYTGFPFRANLTFLKNITFMNIIISAISTGKYKLILQ